MSQLQHQPLMFPKKTFISVVNALTENDAPFKSPPVRKAVGTALREEKWPEELYEPFKSFGPIKHNGVQIRTDKLNGCFAFIQFESPDSAKSAIQASFIRIGNRKLNIQEKKRRGSENHRLSQESINGNANGQNYFYGCRNSNGHNGPDN
ncbi:hypothetical protein PTKIN_Ptkin01aG0259900 [Pterospermum kingtungense]